MEKEILRNQIRKGEVLFNTGKLEDAEKHFLNILRKEPKNPEILNNLGAISYHKNNVKKAIEIFFLTLKFNPYYKNTIINLFFILKNNNKNVLILKPLIEIYLKKFPNDNQVKRIHSKICMIDKNLKIGKIKHIISFEIPKLLKEANEQEPFNDITISMSSYNRGDILISDIKKGYKFGKQPLVIVDDFSKEDQRKIINKIDSEYNHIKIVYHDKNCGVAQALRTSLNYIDTPYIQFLDDDDILLCKDENDFDKNISQLKNTFLVIPRYIINLNKDSTIQIGYDRTKLNNLSAEEILTYMCKTGEMLALRAGGIFHTNHVKKSLPENIFKVSEDYVMLARILSKNLDKKLLLSDAYYYIRRIQNDTLSKTVNIEKICLNLLSIIIAAYYCITNKLITRSKFIENFNNRLELLKSLYNFDNQVENICRNFIKKEISLKSFMHKMNRYIPSLSYENVPKEIEYFSQLPIVNKSVYCKRGKIVSNNEKINSKYFVNNNIDIFLKNEKKSINLAWYAGAGGKNWGDALSPLLTYLISKRKIRFISPWDTSETFRYYVIGSLLPPSNSNCEIWGAGIMKENETIRYLPKKIHAVRGPLTREIFLKFDIDCPEVYGDPALLYPIFFNPNIEKKYKYGIVPHYIDTDNPWIEKLKTKQGIKIINILDPINKVVREIKSCEMILSSSLHGIICGDSYGIPSYWIELSNKVSGDGFKFKDYFASVEREESVPIKPKLSDNIHDYRSYFYNYKIKLEKIRNNLYNSCPFKSDSLLPM